jgi:hypothetical protein
VLAKISTHSRWQLASSPNRSAFNTLVRALHAQIIAVYIFGRPGSQNGNSALLAFPQLRNDGLISGPIESDSTKGVCLELLPQALPATVGESRGGYGLGATACSDWGGHGYCPDFEVERDIGGNDQ